MNIKQTALKRDSLVLAHIVHNVGYQGKKKIRKSVLNKTYNLRSVVYS